MDTPESAPDRARGKDSDAHQTRLVTLVFTDLVDSVVLRRHLGDQAATTLLQTHRQAVRELLQRAADAEEIETAGDSFLLLFARPSDAVKFALVLERQTCTLAEERKVALAVRIGIHVGEVVIEEHVQGPKAKDLYGSQIDLCARVMSLAQGGQILLTRAVFDSARQSLKGEELHGLNDLQWLDHGPYVLKGIEEPVDICEVGEVGVGVLKAPVSSDKAQPRARLGEEPVLGWRPAVGQFVPNTRWFLEQKLGEGGFGEVWLGRHQHTKERRVFKFCFQAGRVRFLKREMTLFRVLKVRIGDHANIVRLHDVMLEQPPFYVEMDYVEGADLRTWCKEHGGAEVIPMETRFEIVAQAAEGLQAAHEAGIIHRDIKPANILIGGKGTGPTEVRVKITDFGIGQVVSEESLQGITRAGFTQTILSDSSSSQTGTQLYLAPELLAGKSVSTRSDIYSLGVVLYQLLVGDFTRPVTGDWASEIQDPLLREDLQHCLAGKPQDRFAGADQVAKHLWALPERRKELARREAEKLALERAAYRRGIIRTAGVAGVIVVAILVLAMVALNQSQKAKASAAVARQSLYEADMLLTYRAVGEGNLGLALDLLNKHRPSPGHVDLRGWEWRYLWGLCQSDELGVFSTNSTSRSIRLALSKDGKLISTTESIKRTASVYLWEFPSGRLLATPETNDASGSVALAPDGKLMAFGTRNHGIKLWDIEGSREITNFSGVFGNGWFSVLEFSPDGRNLAASRDEPEVVVWDMTTKAANKLLTGGHSKFISSLAFSPDGQTIATGSFDNTVRLWSLSDGRPVSPPLVGHEAAIQSLAFSPDGTLLASGSWDHTVKIWAVATQREIEHLTNHSRLVTSVSFSPDQKILASSSTDFTIRLWDTARWEPLTILRGSPDEIWSVAFLPDGKTLVSGGKDGAIRTWSGVPKSPKPDLLQRPGEPAGWAELAESSNAASRDYRMQRSHDAQEWGVCGGMVYCARTNGTIIYWNASTLHQGTQYTWPGEVRTNSVARDFSPGGKLVWANNQGEVVVWNLIAARELARLPWIPGTAKFLKISPDEKVLVGGAPEARTVTVWDLQTFRKICNMPKAGESDPAVRGSHISAVDVVSFSIDSHLFAYGNWNGSIEVWNLLRQERVANWAIHQEPVSGLAFTPDGKRVVSASTDATAKLWDIETGRDVKPFARALNTFDCVAVAPDGQRVAGATGDGFINVWNLSSRQLVATLKVGLRAEAAESVFALQFLPPDGNNLLACTESQARLWHAPSWAEIEAAEAKHRIRTH